MEGGNGSDGVLPWCFPDLDAQNPPSPVSPSSSPHPCQIKIEKYATVGEKKITEFSK